MLGTDQPRFQGTFLQSHLTISPQGNDLAFERAKVLIKISLDNTTLETTPVQQNIQNDT